MRNKFEELLKRILENENYKILDAGAREGSFKYLDEAKVFFIDNDTKFLPSKNKNFIYADCAKIPFKNNSFDVAILKYVLEHAYFPNEIIYELSKVIKENGYLVIVVPKWYSFQDLFYKTLGFFAQMLGKGKQAHIQSFSFKKICDLCYKYNFVLLAYTEYDSGLSFLDKTEKRKLIKKIIMKIISIIYEMTKINLLAKGEMYFIFQKIK